MRFSIAATFLLFIFLLPTFGQQYGKVSYYSNRLKGRKTSNGERYNPRMFTAAHRTYNFGTILKVTNIDNGKIVVVRVTDRGPYARGRIVDISYVAAKQIGLIATGHANAKVEESEDLRFLLYPETLLNVDWPIRMEEIPQKITIPNQIKNGQN